MGTSRSAYLKWEGGSNQVQKEAGAREIEENLGRERVPPAPELYENE
jgi:hypothetical protein